ncbi:hypothetical protein [Streptomyces sp. 049-1]|uniref:hypothetical protein n=1 Tax=Streptomyces sp. 049-1 TaxID=2789264 RepID=UPI00397F60AE
MTRAPALPPARLDTPLQETPRGPAPRSAFLVQVSHAALENDVVAVRDDQFTYRRATIREADLTSGKAVVCVLRTVERWASQKQGP